MGQVLARRTSTARKPACGSDGPRRTAAEFSGWRRQHRVLITASEIHPEHELRLSRGAGPIAAVQRPGDLSLLAMGLCRVGEEGAIAAGYSVVSLCRPDRLLGHLGRRDNARRIIAPSSDRRTSIPIPRTCRATWTGSGRLGPLSKAPGPSARSRGPHDASESLSSRGP
jgi:hypothetical protein